MAGPQLMFEVFDIVYALPAKIPRLFTDKMNARSDRDESVQPVFLFSKTENLYEKIYSLVYFPCFASDTQKKQ